MARVTELKARGDDFGGGRFAPTEPSDYQDRPFKPAIGELKTKPVRSRRSTVPAAFQPVSLPKAALRSSPAPL